MMEPTVLRTVDASDLLGIGADEVQRLLADRYFEPIGDGRLDLAQVVRGYVRALRDEAQRASASTAAVRLQAARLRAVELRNAEADGHAIEDVEQVDIFTEAFGGMKATWLGLSVRIGGRDLDARRRIEDAINAILNRISDEIEARSEAP